MYSKFVPALVAIVLAASFAQAADNATSAKDRESCTGSTYEMRVCLVSHLERHEKELESTFDDLVFRLRSIEAFHSKSNVATIADPDEVLDLRNVQKIWRQFLYAECGWKRSLHGTGSMAPLVSLGCQIDLVKTRKDKLGFLRDGYKDQGYGEKP